jgi:hypothetical protein
MRGAVLRECNKLQVSQMANTVVLVEVLFNVEGSDNGLEWIKLYNRSNEPVDLASWSVGWGGDDFTYGVLQLSGIVGPDSCFIVGGPESNAESGNPNFDQVANFNPDLQNSDSSGPGDGIALFDLPADQINAGTVPVDSVVYGPDNNSGLLGPNGNPYPTALVGIGNPGNSIVRNDSGAWVVNTTPNSQACISIP